MKKLIFYIMARKILLIPFLLIGFVSYSQTLQYINTYGYDYNKFKARDLMGLPNDTFTVPATLQDVKWIARKGTTTYFWNTTSFIWEASGGASSLIAGEGITITGDSVHIGGILSSPGVKFSQNRTINTNRNGMYWANGSIPDLVDPGGIAWDFGQEVFSPFQFASRDTVNANDVDPPTAAVPWSGIYARRELYYPTGVFRTQKVFGHQFEMNWLWDDTLSLRTEEGDYNVGTSFKNVFRPYGTDRQGIRASHGTGQNNSIAYAAPAVLAVTQLENTASNYIKVDGHLSGFNSYLVMGANTADTLKAYVYYTTGAFVSPTSLIQRSYDFAPSADFASPRVDSAYGWFDTVRVKFQHFSGKTVFGPTRASAHAWASSDIFKVIGNVNITDSLHLGKASPIGDSTGFDWVIRRRTDGSLFRINASDMAAFFGGGSGANTALSNLAAVAINTSLVSDADNTDDLGSSANSWKDIYSRRLRLDGSTSGTVDIASDALSNVATGTNLSGEGFIPFVQSIIVRSDETLTNTNTDQNLFTNIAHDVITVQANTTYEFYITGDFTHGAVSHSIALGFTPTTAVVTRIEYNAYAWVTAVGTATASQVSTRVKSTATTAINLAGANATETFEAKGTITIGATGGTITPQIKFSSDPTGTILLKEGARMMIWPIGNDTFTQQGNIN